MRPVWKGDISFGLVTIPVSIFPAEQKNELHFHLLDAKDKARIRYQRINTDTGKEVPWDDIVKAYEFDKDSYIIINEKAFEKASPDVFKSIDIEEFVDFSAIDNLLFDKPYYMVPNSKNQKAYVLLREALKKTNRVGVAKIIIRTKEHLSLIIPHNDALILNIIRFQEEIRDEQELQLPHESLKHYKISAREMKMATDLIKEMSVPWKPEKYHNDYQEALKEWLEKQAQKQQKAPNKKAASGNKEDIIDFISLLKKSMGKKKSTGAKRKKS